MAALAGIGAFQADYHCGAPVFGSHPAVYDLESMVDYPSHPGDEEHREYSSYSSGYQSAPVPGTYISPYPPPTAPMYTDQHVQAQQHHYHQMQHYHDHRAQTYSMSPTSSTTSHYQTATAPSLVRTVSTASGYSHSSQNANQLYVQSSHGQEYIAQMQGYQIAGQNTLSASASVEDESDTGVETRPSPSAQVSTSSTRSSKSSRSRVCQVEGCSSAFKRKADLDRHEKCVHQKEQNKVYECDAPRCDRKGDKAFTRRDHLVEHQRNYHSRDIPKRMRGKGREEDIPYYPMGGGS